MQRTWGRFRSVVWGIAVVLAFGGWEGIAEAAAPVRVDLSARPRIVNGLETHEYPTTGAMLYHPGSPITPDNAQLYCSGTLIGCETFVVAAHCVADPTPSRYAVFLQHAGIVSVAAVVRHPDFLPDQFPKHDIAVLKLAAPVTGIEPSAIAASDPLPLLPLSGTIVGFGQTQGGAFDYGLKRAGAVLVESCPVIPNVSEGDVLCWGFFTPVGPPGTDSNTCNGDSGGPLFVDLGGGTVLGGVTSGGSTQSCLADDVSFDANVYTYRDFVLAQLGADSTTTCGGLPAAGGPDAPVVSFAGALDASYPTETYTIAVPDGADLLRVTLNGRDDGVFDPDLYVKAGPDASPDSFDCAANGASAFGECAFAAPAPGTWSLAVHRAAGAGRYQVTATLFGGTNATCGNGVREFGESCDGADAESCPGECAADCTCPGPVCGNGVREQGEACDGNDAALCPDACSDSCQCPPPCSTDVMGGTLVRLAAARLKIRTLVVDDGTFAGADPRQGFTLTAMQGAHGIALDVPASDPGWARSRPDRGRYLWAGHAPGITRIKVIDRTARDGTWKVIVIGKQVPGSGTFNPGMPIELRLAMGGAGACATDSFP